MISEKDMSEILYKVAEEIRKDLGIDEKFKIEILSGWPKPFEYCCLCIGLVSENKKIYGVRIKINTEHNLRDAIFHLLHEMKHAHYFYKNSNDYNSESSIFEELKADLFAIRKFLNAYRIAKKYLNEKSANYRK